MTTSAQWVGRWTFVERLEALFSWACLQSEAAASIPPIRLNQTDYPDGEAPGKLLTPNINRRGLPFTPAFERYLDGHESKAPIIMALEDIHSGISQQSFSRGMDVRLEFEICWAVVMGRHDDLETLRAILGRPNGFDEAARRGLALLKEKTTNIVQKRVAETGERRQSAGEAQQARAEDQSKRQRKGRVVV